MADTQVGEFEAGRRVQVAPEQLFAVAADVSTLAQWVPPASGVHEVGPDVVEFEHHGVTDEALWRARPEQRRLEWGSRSDGSYAGWLQVNAQGEDDWSEAVIHLSFLPVPGGADGDGNGSAGGDVEGEGSGTRAQHPRPSDDDVEVILQQALDRLADLATQSRGSE
ncbi:MAG: hypothetical protein ACTHNT_06165 [Actinomycetales bacterium]